MVIAFLSRYLVKASLLTIAVLLSSCASSYKVNDCVRELGYNANETITAVATGGAIETQHTNKYYDSNPPKTRVEVYNKQQQEKLVKVKCN